MANIKQLVENKSSLDYPALCKALVEQFGITEKVNWDSVLPAPQQQELFGGEVLRFVEKHPQLSSQKDIRPITLKKGSTSQMLFFYVCLADSTLPKKHIEQITKRFIKGADANRYIIWFFGNKEASELKLVLSAKEGRKVVLKTLPFGIEQPYYKTYDFILNEVAAKLQQLFVEPTDLWKALWKAFDISIINRRFYDEIKLAFDSLIEQIEKKSNPFKNEEERVQFAIRLLGRIIFCWFLKRKGIIKEDAVSSSAISNYKGRNYYHELLEPLFFEVMNKPEKERVGGLPKIIAHYPFLNGGLFDANKETDFYDAETSTPNFRLQIENDWFYKFFSNTLEKYNFTVDENSSSNAEIAIDPEMLGRIFENLLAEQNPETGESARKVTGSFYTPREIVDYMVEQSIAEYLKTALGKAEEQQDLERNLFGVVSNQELKLKESKHDKAAEKLNAALDDFAHTGHLPDELKTQAQVILDALNNIKVLDPACGSGAFPIGVLQKLIALKQEITQLQNPKKQLSQAAAYKLKLDTIQKSIYGVDIQPMAVELSRLRCWLSLVVDEEIDNIKALPNLDFKFVCADTLAELPEMKQLNLGAATEETVERLKELRSEYFLSSGKQKMKLENDFNTIQRKLFKTIAEWVGKSEAVSLLAGWKPFDNHKTSWFDIFWMFGFREGFDILIGNPPYAQLQNLNLPNSTIEYYKKKFYSAQYKIDLYHLFIETALNLSANRGIICYITPITFLKNKFNNKLRETIFKNSYVNKIVRFFISVFNQASVDNAIFILQKRNYQKDQNVLNDIKVYDVNNETFFEEVSTPKIISQNTIQSPDYLFDIDSNAENSQILKIIESNHKLKDYGRSYFGIQTYDRSQFVSIKKENKNYVPVVDGTNVLKYQLLPSNEFVCFTPEAIKSGGNSEVYKKARILVRQIGKYPEGVYCKPGIYTLNTIYNIFLNENAAIELKYLLALINSKVISFYWKNKFYDSKETFPKIKKAPLESIPTKEVPVSIQNILIRLVDYTLIVKSLEENINEYVPNEHIAKQFEDLIDGCVYELYFEKEVKAKEADVLALVDQNFKSIDGKEEPEQIKIIQEGYQLLRDSHHEIRSRMARQKLVEEIAIIQNSQA